MPVNGVATLLPLDGLATSNKKYAKSGRDTSFIGPLTASGYWSTRMAVDVTMPMPVLAMAMSVGGTFRADLTMPSMTFASRMGMQVDLDMPMPVAAGHMNVMTVMRADLIMPAMVGDGTGHMTVGAVGGAALVLPRMALAGAFGWGVAGRLPALQGSAAMSWEGVGRMAAHLPMLQLAGTIVVESLPWFVRGDLPPLVAVPGMRAALTLPGFLLSAYGGLATPAAGTVWCLNMRTGAVSRWPGVPFTQVLRAGKDAFAIGPDGLYKLGGDTDDGDPIDWTFETGLDDLGRAGVKRMPYLYLDGLIDGEIEITLIDDRNREFTYYYDTKERGAVHMPHRRKLGNGVQSRHFALRVRSKTGAYIELDSLEPEISVSQRSV